MSNALKKSKHTFFTFSVNKQDVISRLKNEVRGFPFYAYIDHIPDDEDGSNHTHFIIRTNPITIDNLSQQLDLPSNFIQWVRVKRSMIRYFVHEDNPEKTHYDREAIITNDRAFVDKQFVDAPPLVYDQYIDYCRVLDGQISIKDYLASYSLDVASLSFSSRVKLFDSLYFAEKNRRYNFEERSLN